MNSKKAEVLIEKYWNGATSQSEEQELKKYFSSDVGSSHHDARYFQHLSRKSGTRTLDGSFDDAVLRKISQERPASKTRSLSLRFWFAAASVMILLSIGIIFKNVIIEEKTPVQLAEMDTYDDPQKAFEETKKALLFISSKLNESGNYATQISRFEESQEIVKQN